MNRLSCLEIQDNFISNIVPHTFAICYKSRDQDVESQLFFDSVRDHYQLMRVGWNGLKRVYHTVLHFDIKDGKIWLQQNTTDIDVGQELQEMGIPKEDIILGLHPPYKRPYTGYGIA